MIVVGIIHWRRAARPRKQKATADRLDRPQVLFVVVLANSQLSTSSPATMYRVVRTMNSAAPALWPIEYLIFLIGLAAPYVVLAIALTRIPAFAHRVSQAVTSLEHRDLRRPVAVLVMAIGAVLVIWSGVGMLRTP